MRGENITRGQLIANEIRRKKAEASKPKEEPEPLYEEEGLEEIYEEDKPLDPKAARRARLREILSR